MYCKNCKQKLDKADKFCTGCGTAVQNSNTLPQTATTPQPEKWWYRLLKVIYIIVFVASIAITCVIAYSTLPQKTLDGNRSTIQCNNGKNYAPAKNSIYLYSDSLSTYDDQHARILCAYDTTNYYSTYWTAPSYVNYTFVAVYNDAPYTSWFFYSILALAIVWVLLKLVRVGVQYVAFGNKPYWKSEFKKYY